jgi:hypothetical protein
MVSTCSSSISSCTSPHVDVGEHPLQVADTQRQLLHFTEALVHAFEPFRHLPERFGQARFQRRVEFLVNRLAHLLEALAVIRLQVANLVLERRAHFQHALRVRLGHRGQRLRQRIGHALQAARLLVAAQRRVLANLLAHAVEVLDGGGVVLRQAGCRILARGLGAQLHFAPQRVLQAVEGVTVSGAPAQQRQHLQRDDRQRRKRQQVEVKIGHQSALLRIQSAVS